MSGVVAPVDLHKGAFLVAVRASFASFTVFLFKEEITAFLAIVYLLTLTFAIRPLFGHELIIILRETDDGHLNRRFCGHKVSCCDLQARHRLRGDGRCGARSLDRLLW